MCINAIHWFEFMGSCGLILSNKGDVINVNINNSQLPSLLYKQ